MINKKKFKEASQVYEEILRKESDNIDALNSLAHCLLEQDKSNEEKALRLYDRALRLDPNDFETNFNLGLFHYRQRKDYEKALQYLTAGQDYENNCTALYNIAYIHEEKGDLENA